MALEAPVYSVYETEVNLEHKTLTLYPIPQTLLGIAAHILLYSSWRRNWQNKIPKMINYV